jgi:hypothetical protein
VVSASSGCRVVASCLKHSNKPAGSTQVQENLECLSNYVQLKKSYGMGSLAGMIKIITSSRVSCDSKNSLSIFKQELTLNTYSSRLGHRVAEESIEETLNFA